MFSLSENYHLRKCFLQREEVPTQTMMKEKMSPALAAVYFNSMTPGLKRIAGLEPRLVGGGNNWYQPPDELIAGRAVMKPVRKQVLNKLNSDGLTIIANSVFLRHRRAMEAALEKAIEDSEDNWKNIIKNTTRRLWEELVEAAKRKNTELIQNDFNKFVYLYRNCLGKIEVLFHESAIKEINNVRENSLYEMQIKYATLLKHQATSMYEEYEKKLMEEKNRLKKEFIQNLENNRTEMADKIHDLKVDKHVAIYKIEQYLHCRKVACQIYVSLKEQEECLKETEELKLKHKKKVEVFTDTMLMQDFQIRLQEEKEKKKLGFCNIWRKKVCRVVKAFQMFVSHCLNKFPEQADFFINIEKLMLLQLNEALQDPSVASIIELEKEFHTPVPQIRPFYLFCDKGYKPKLNEDLCRKPSNVSSTSDIPVIIVNKKCLYAACDNFDQFTNKMKEFIHGNRGDDAEFKDDLVYEHFVPVKYMDSQQLTEMKLESSLLQILQAEMQTETEGKKMEKMETVEQIPVTCKGCKLPWCPCQTLVDGRLDDSAKIKTEPSPVITYRAAPHTLPTIDRSVELDHEREPKWDSFCWHVKPKKCSCAKIAKKYLADNIPAYMTRIRYGPPEMPEYEMCSLQELKNLVKEARKEFREDHVPVDVTVVLPKNKDVSTQCCAPEYEMMCTCYSDDEFSQINDTKLSTSQKIKLPSMSPSFLTHEVESFAALRARSLRNLIDNFSDLETIFKKDSCDFN